MPILLSLLPLWRWLKQAAGTLLDHARRYPLQCAIIALCALSLWLWHGKSDALAQRDKARAETKALAADYAKAQALAAAKQADAERREFALKTDLAEKAHDLATKSAADARSAVDAYARAHPVRVCLQAADSEPGGTAGPGVFGDSRRAPDPDPVAEMVAVSRADLDTLSGKAVQDSVKGEFLNALVAAGWAVPASKVPEVGF